MTGSLFGPSIGTVCILSRTGQAKREYSYKVNACDLRLSHSQTIRCLCFLAFMIVFVLVGHSNFALWHRSVLKPDGSLTEIALEITPAFEWRTGPERGCGHGWCEDTESYLFVRFVRRHWGAWYLR